MKKLIPLFVVVGVFLAATFYTAEKTDFKKCYKACMAKIDDKKSCTYICDENGKRNEN